MDISSPLAGTHSTSSTKYAKGTSSPPPADGDQTGSAGSASASGGSADTLSLSKLASSLKGPSLDLFNKLKQNERDLLGDLVNNGKVTGDDVNNALMNSLKQARRTAFATGSMMFEAMNPSLFTRPETVTAEEMQKATGDTLARRKTLVSRLEELEKNGQAGSDDYSETLRALSGSESGTASQDMPVNGHPRSTRIVSPYRMNLGDSRFLQSGAEEAAGNKLEAAGFSLSSLSKTARSVAEDDVAGIVSEQASELASIMQRTGG